MKVGRNRQREVRNAQNGREGTDYGSGRYLSVIEMLRIKKEGFCY